MPIIQSAKKKLRQDKRKQKVNEQYRLKIRKSIKEAKKAKNKKSASEMVRKAYSVIGRAAKKKVIHKNKANRLKSRISKLLGAK